MSFVLIATHKSSSAQWIIAAERLAVKYDRRVCCEVRTPWIKPVVEIAWMSTCASWSLCARKAAVGIDRRYSSSMNDVLPRGRAIIQLHQLMHHKKCTQTCMSTGRARTLLCARSSSEDFRCFSRTKPVSDCSDPLFCSDTDLMMCLRKGLGFYEHMQRMNLTEKEGTPYYVIDVMRKWLIFYSFMYCHLSSWSHYKCCLVHTQWTCQ